MVRLNTLISKISEARTLWSKIGGRDAANSEMISRGEFGRNNNAIERYKNRIAYGIGNEGKNSRLSTDRTNRQAVSDVGTLISSLVSSGRLSARKRDTDYLNRRTRITEEKLRVFDFDDTIAKSKSRVGIRDKRTGKVRKITPAQFAKYKPKSHEETDFSEFDHVIKPKRVKEIHSILKNLAKKKRSFMVLTARGNKAKKPIRQYLEKEGLYHPKRVRITTVASSDPESKSKTIGKHLNTGKYTHLEFFDDSGPNVDAVSALKDKYPNVRIRSRQIHYAEKKK